MPTNLPTPPTGRLLYQANEAMWSVGDPADAREVFAAAYQAAERQADPRAVAEAALGLAGLWVQEERSAIAAVMVDDRLRRALADLPDDGPLAARLKVRLAAESNHRTGGHDEIVRWLESARAMGDPVVLAEALKLAHQCLLDPVHRGLRTPLAKELVAESARTSRRGDLIIGLLLHAVDLLLDGDLRASRNLAELRAVLEDKDHLAVRRQLHAIDLMAMIRAGRLTAAETAAAQRAEEAISIGAKDAVMWHGVHTTAIRWFQGRIGTLPGALRELAESPAPEMTDRSLDALHIVAAAHAGQRREAVGAMATFRDGPAAVAPSPTRLLTWYALAEAAWLLERADVAEEVFDLLLPHRRLPVMAGMATVCFGSVEQALGIAKLTTGDFEGAADHLCRAVQENRRLSHWPAAALAEHRLAFALARGDDPERRRSSRQYALAAERHAGEFGMDLSPFTATLETLSATQSPPVLSDAAVGEAPEIQQAAQPGGDSLTDAPRRPTIYSSGVVFSRQGRVWQVIAGSRSAFVRHSRGMAYLAVLVANPGREITAIELFGGPPSADPPLVSVDAFDVFEANVSYQPLLDEQARRQYQARLSELREIIEHCEGVGDLVESAAARAEKEWLLEQLQSALGLSGRRRTFATDYERARISVGKAIRRALAKISEADEHLGSMLSEAVRTGRKCEYQPSKSRAGTATTSSE